jgi:hypothetical protein
VPAPVAPVAQKTISDADIQVAIERGDRSTLEQLWGQIKKQQQFRINRAGLDPIEKKVTFVSDSDRIAMESAEARRQLRELSVNQVRRSVPLGVTEVLFEANCYNNLYGASLPKWGPGGGIHVVLSINGSLVQPLAEAAAPSDSVSLFPQEHGLFPRQGGVVTYTPLYRSAIYERASERAWFVFPLLSGDVQKITVIAISGLGNRKEKELANPFR